MTRTRRMQLVSVAEKWRLTLEEAAQLCGLSANSVRDLEARREFPPRTRVKLHGPGEESGKLQFVAAEVRAWANGEDWRALVEKRQAREDVAHAS